MDNPVYHKAHYRLYTIFMLPQLRILDFSKVRQRERDAAAKMFGGLSQEKLETIVGRKGDDGGAMTAQMQAEAQRIKVRHLDPVFGALLMLLTRVWRMQEAISKAGSLEEVQRLERILKSGGTLEAPVSGVPPRAGDADEMEE